MEKNANLHPSIQKSFNDFQKKLDKGHNFVDYFLTIGLEPEIALKPWLYEASINDLNTLYKKNLTPKIINKFPSFEKKLLGFDDAIIQHIFPLGFQIIEILNNPPKEKFFSIILDNNMFSIKHPYKFVSCLLFYEPLANYYKIYEKYNDINLHASDINNSNQNLINISNYLDNNNNGLFVFKDNISTISSITYGPSINNNISMYINNDNNNNKQPVFKNNNIRVSDLSQKETNISSIINSCNKNNINNNNSNIKNSNLEKYFVPKCICLISLYPFINEYKTILMKLYSYFKMENIDIPLEKIINNLILEIPLPPRGLFSIEYPIIDKNLLLQNSKINSLFYSSFEFKILFMKFTIADVLEIFRYLMLGIKIIFFSSEIEYLTPIIFSSLLFLFPFKFPFSVVSILPKESYNYIENIPITGINEKYYPEFFKSNDICIDEDLLIVNIDEQRLEHVSNNNKRNQSKIPNLPKKISYKLSQKLLNYLNKCNKGIKEGKRETNELLEKTVRKYFLEFQAELLKDYPKFLNNNIYMHPNVPNVEPLNIEKFLKTIDKDDLNFYKQFLKTQMFTDYIYKRMTPNDKKEMTEVLIFEEKIFEMKGQKDKIVYTNSNAFNFTKKYTTPKVNKNLNENIFKYYSNEQNHKNLLLEGIVINNNYINDISILSNQNNPIMEINNKSLKYNYILFPKLNCDFFYKNDIKSYYLDDSFYSEINKLNTELISKSHLNRVETPTNEIMNYIYLIWLKVWSNTFYYHDKIEQKYRYLQMIKIFKKINQHEMSVLNHLFQALIKSNANEDLIYHLYNIFIKYNLSPSYEVFDAVKTMIKKKLKSAGKPSSNDISKFLENKTKIKCTKEETDIKKFRKRTMKNIYDEYTITEKITFSMDNICNECENKINISDFQKNLNNTNNDIFWAKCPFCQCNYIPMLKIIFGSEINKNNKLKKETSLVDVVCLCSPKTLQMEYLDYSNIDIDKFKISNNQTFWNLIWYFKLIGLPYDFILPYTENIFRPKNKKQLNRNFIKVVFNNNDTKEEENNQLKVLKIEKNDLNPQMKIQGNNIIENKNIINNNNQYNTIVHKIDNNDNKYNLFTTIQQKSDKKISSMNKIIKLMPKTICNNMNNINKMNQQNINQALNPSKINPTKIVKTNRNIQNYSIALNRGYKIAIPTSNNTPIRMISPQMKYSPSLKYYNYNNYQVNIIPTLKYSNSMINNAMIYNNTMNNFSTINYNNNINKRNYIIYRPQNIIQNPQVYTSYINYNK